MNINRWTFKISNKEVNASFKTYLRQNVRQNIKFLVMFYTVILVLFFSYEQRFCPRIYCAIGNLMVAGLAWFVTAHHLWTIDLFSLLFSLSVCVSMTILTFTETDWVEIEEIVTYLILISITGPIVLQVLL
jgi:hypothetical protein